MTRTQRQFVFFGALLMLNATLVFLGFALGLMDDLPGAGELPGPLASMPKWCTGVPIVYSVLTVRRTLLARHPGTS